MLNEKPKLKNDAEPEVTHKQHFSRLFARSAIEIGIVFLAIPTLALLCHWVLGFITALSD